MAFQGWRIGTLVLAASLTLAACGGSDTDTASSGTPPASSSGNPAPSPPAPPPSSGDTGAPTTAANAAPIVTGTPSGTVSAGQAWTFQPSATDPDGDAVTWSISGKPADAVFSTASGELAWTPTAGAAWSNIVITATDSRGAATSLAPFSLTVDQPVQQLAGNATLVWDLPQQYTDGSALAADDEVVGYRVYHGTSQDALDLVAPVQGATTLQHTVSNLTAGTHYFAVSAVSISGAEGARSEILSKTVM